VSVLGQRIIAFLDILGFSDRLTEGHLEELAGAYGDLIDDAKSRVFGQSDAGVSVRNFEIGQFLFDSVVLISKPLGHDAPASVFHFFSALNILFEESFRRKLPLRGAVGIGNVVEDPSRGLLLSDIFPALVRAEKSMEWSGVILLPESADEILLALYGTVESELPRSREGHVVEYDVPLKGESSARRWCLNWVSAAEPPTIAAGLAFLKEPKKTNTKGFISYVESLPTGSVLAPPSLDPIHRVIVQATRAGFNIKFLDKNGLGVDPRPGTRFTIQIVDPATGKRRDTEVGGPV
jgi:hypothetical protein